MNDKQVHALIENGKLPDCGREVKLKETHISWLLLCEDYVFKIKRPVTFVFLDFSTLELRKHFCEQELMLNNRLAPEMYIGVIPITAGMISGNDDESEVVDYAVKMLRMDNSKEMIHLLKEDKVTEDAIVNLAKKIASFHQNTQVIKNAFNTTAFDKDYAKILNHETFIDEELGNELAGKVKKAVEKSTTYLNTNRSLMNERIISGFQRDCHGDFNAHNIFLYEDPVIFDCIEFSKDLRHIDLLNEIAFLCVDLDFYDRQDLSGLFYNQYLEFMELDQGADEDRLFNYYKSYRANIRATVTILHEKNKTEHERKKITLNDIKKYLLLMDSYLAEV